MWLNNRGKEATINKMTSLKKQNLYLKMQNRKRVKILIWKMQNHNNLYQKLIPRSNLLKAWKLIIQSP